MLPIATSKTCPSWKSRDPGSEVTQCSLAALGMAVKRERPVPSKQWSCSELKDGQKTLLKVKNEKDDDLERKIKEQILLVHAMHMFSQEFDGKYTTLNKFWGLDVIVVTFSPAMLSPYMFFLFVCTIQNAKGVGSLPISQEYERQLEEMKRMMAS